ncbi:hypothetical protein [Terricaulis sp.]|uniref:hypothetical protein n=1 Tax=Terricaulis sp. TaxID=2768686 RepID=UPI003783CA9F
MSLNKTLDRLFDEIRREAKRNPDFANRLDAVLRLHDSRRDVPEEVTAEIESDGVVLTPPPAKPAPEAQKPAVKPSAKPAQGRRMLELLNPVGLYKREGEEALTAMLAKANTETLRALVIEHNLDPSGETEALEDGALAAHIVAQAKRRAERDEKMFDY